MKVKLISYTPNPEKTVAAAARLCYSETSATEIMEDFTDKKQNEFLQKLVDLGHLSPTEHASFTFSIEGVSRALSHQLVRHRIANYSQKSQRYNSEGGFEYVIPPSVKANWEALKVYGDIMRDTEMAYEALEHLVPKEDARYVLPNGCETNLVATFNTRSLYNFFQHRCCTRAQWEIRHMANKMLDEVRQVAPVLFKKAGAVCDTEGHCPEGSMSCGKVN